MFWYKGVVVVLGFFRWVLVFVDLVFECVFGFVMEVLVGELVVGVVDLLGVDGVVVDEVFG